MHHKELELQDTIERIREAKPGQTVPISNNIFNRVMTELADNVNNPKHYNHNRKGIECIQAIEASMTKSQFIGWLKGQVIKYLWRFEYKHKPLEDLKKAEFYLKKLIQELEDGK